MAQPLAFSSLCVSYFYHYCFAVGVYASSVMINISCLVLVVLAEAEVGHWPLCMGAVSANTMANRVLVSVVATR